MKKLAILFLFVFIFAGCDWFQESMDPSLGDPMADEVVVEEEPEVEDTPEEAAADSDSKEVVLAKCLTENGAKLYTAKWCGHCQNQKKAFADGLEYLDHIECAEGDGWAQECKDADVTSVPTWIFADGTKKTGNTALDKLASLSGCEY